MKTMADLIKEKEGKMTGTPTEGTYKLPNGALICWTTSDAGDRMYAGSVDKDSGTVFVPKPASKILVDAAWDIEYSLRSVESATSRSES